MIQTETKYPEAGNWHDFKSFCWFEKPDDADDFCIYHLNHRDSGLLDQSKANAIQKALKPFNNDIQFVTFNHWAVGRIDAVAVRVNTEAYQTLCDTIDRLFEYPILDETDYNELEHKTTLENIKNSSYQVNKDVKIDKLPEDWTCSAFSWFCDNDDSAVENIDDQGGYPDADQLLACISELWPEAINTKVKNNE